MGSGPLAGHAAVLLPISAESAIVLGVVDPDPDPEEPDPDEPDPDPDEPDPEEPDPDEPDPEEPDPDPDEPDPDEPDPDAPDPDGVVPLKFRLAEHAAKLKTKRLASASGSCACLCVINSPRTGLAITPMVLGRRESMQLPFIYAGAMLAQVHGPGSL